MLTEHQRWEVFERDDFRCQACGARHCLTVDHVTPRARGGTDDMTNLRTLCGQCNSSKGARDAAAWTGPAGWTHQACRETPLAIRLPKGLRAKIQHAAAERGITPNGLVVRALRHELDDASGIHLR